MALSQNHETVCPLLCLTLSEGLLPAFGTSPRLYRNWFSALKGFRLTSLIAGTPLFQAERNTALTFQKGL